MPTPAKTSDEAILVAARELLERVGSDAFALSDVAAAVGVRTPSLYKHIADRASLLAALEQRGFEELGASMREHRHHADPLIAMATAYRRFARTSPRLYARMLAPDATRSRASETWRRRALAPVLEVIAERVEPLRELIAARTLTAFIHGWVSMEMAGAFRLGGDLTADFDRALRIVLRGLD